MGGERVGYDLIDIIVKLITHANISTHVENDGEKLMDFVFCEILLHGRNGRVFSLELKKNNYNVITIILKHCYETLHYYDNRSCVD